MTDRRRVVLRDLALRDVENAVDRYRDEVDVETALGFVDALEAAVDHLARHTGTGSPRYATELDLPGLRSWPLRGFPHLVFYVEADHEVIDVWRVLHAHSDISAWLRASDDAPDTE